MSSSSNALILNLLPGWCSAPNLEDQSITMHALIWRVFILLSFITFSLSFQIHSTLKTPKASTLSTNLYSTISPEVASNTFKHESFSANDPDSITIIGAGPAGLAATMRMLKLGKFGDHHYTTTMLTTKLIPPPISFRLPTHLIPPPQPSHPASPPISSRLPTHSSSCNRQESHSVRPPSAPPRSL